ncbi:MAG: hypothetical protein JNL88_08735 [Bacteroidia bacterium]|nr:hypothetical protein [Bacteroidia bacterium]
MALVAFTGIHFVSCREDDFDEPPRNGADPNLTVNMSIDSLKRMYRDSIISFNKIITIDSNWVISGTVTADDKSGNFYKTMVIEDNTAGISIRLDQSEFHTEYPVGRRVFVKLKGLVMGDYGGLIQLGGYIDNTGTSPEAAPIPLSLVDEHLIGGVYNLNPQPSVVTILELSNTDKWQNRLIEIEDCEFDPADTAQPYADAVLLQSVNRIVNDCNGGSIIVRSSGYSSFATKLTPTGKGSIKGIFSVYNSDLQLIIRDTTDVVMDSLRCNGAGGPATLISISAVRGLYSGTTIPINGNVYILGVVTSDRSTSNLNGRNLFIQDATGGICVRFAANHSFNLGDSLYINIAGQSLGEFSGLLQVGTSTPNVPLANATVLATGKTVSPQVVTVSQVLANMASNDSWESSLLKINNASISGAATYAGSLQITDATGTMTLYTASGATFAGAAVATGVVSITGILTDYNGTVTPPNTNAQLQIRNTTDVQ